MATNHYAPGVLVPDITVLTEAQWLEKRRNGIGGSDAAKILGISPFVTRKELYWDKINIPHAHDPREENWIAKEIGHRLESLVIKIFERSNPGWKVFYDRRMFFHPEYPWMLADVDGLVRDPRTGKLYIVEVKTCSVQALDKWGRRTHVSICPKTGPITVIDRNPATNTEQRGVTKRSSISGTLLCSHFSTAAISHTARITGMTCP